MRVHLLNLTGISELTKITKRTSTLQTLLSSVLEHDNRTWSVSMDCLICRKTVTSMDLSFFLVIKENLHRQIEKNETQKYNEDADLK